MKVLQLCKKYPFPIKDGEGVAVNYLARAISDSGIDIDLLSFNTTKHFSENINTKETEIYGSVDTVNLDNSISYFHTLVNIFSNKSLHIQRFQSSEFEQKLIELLTNNEYDIVMIESLFLCSYIDVIKGNSDAKVVLRAHNVEHEIWANLSKNSTSIIKKWYFGLTHKRLRDFEISVMDKIDMLVPISEKDAEKYKALGYKGNMAVTNIGIDTDEYRYEFIDNTNLAFIGSLDWLPNIEGLRWFLDNVWRLLPSHRSLLTIAGRNCPTSLSKYANANTQILGEVDNISEVYDTSSMLIVPIFSGSGVRVKILEAMAMGKVVLSTTKGAEGIKYTNFKNILIWNSAQEVSGMLEMIYKGQINLKEISLNARKLIETEYNYMTVASEMIDKFKTITVQ